MVIQGVIRPPPEIRAVADRTALYVSKNGRAFETRIVNSAKGKTPKFAFLQPTNPFHAYYEQRIQFYEAGGKDGDDDADKKKHQEGKEAAEAKAVEEKKANDAEAQKAKQQQAQLIQSVPDPVAKALLTQRNKIAQIRSKFDPKDSSEQLDSDEATNQVPTNAAIIPPPPPFHFINIVSPSSLTVAQIETIQLVAQMTALDGKGGGFLQALTLREWGNPQFAFCQPRHGHFAYFSALVDAYRRVLQLWTHNNDENPLDEDDLVPQISNNIPKCLELAAYRCEYERDQATFRQKEGPGGIVPTAAKIDWHDFVVVETIDFPVTEQVVTLPPPPTAGSITTTTTTTAPSNKQRAKAVTTDDMQNDSDEEEPSETIRVVPSYTPKVVSATQNKSTEMVIDPITGKSVPIQDMPEHMRIQLLDPKWAEERKKFQDKQKESNLVGDSIIASNLERIAGGVNAADALLSKDAAEKRLQDANKLLREQALQPHTPVGPALPGTAPRPPPGFEQPTKKQRMDNPATSSLPPPPTRGPPMRPPVETMDPFAAALTATVQDDTAVPPPTSPIPVPTAHNPIPVSAVAPSTGGELMSESAFIASLARPDAVTLQVRIPTDMTHMAWNFYGQIVSLTVHVSSLTKAVKQELSRVHLNGMPPNKIQLKHAERGIFLKDGQSLAALNIGPGSTLELVPKSRGGRK